MSRDSIQTNQMSKIKGIDRVPLVVTYHPELPSLGKILHYHLPTLYIPEKKMKKAVPKPPLVANKWLKNLNDTSVRMTM